MIWVIGDVEGKQYKEPFSKGIMSRSLNVADIGTERAHEIAGDIEQDLLKNNITEITSSDLAGAVLNHLDRIDPKIALKYKNWRSLRTSEKPLIILIGGASGVGTSSMAFELASRLRLKNLISTDMIREVMRKIVSKELSPVIPQHEHDSCPECGKCTANNCDGDVTEKCQGHVEPKPGKGGKSCAMTSVRFISLFIGATTLFSLVFRKRD